MKWISSKQAAELGKSLAAIVLALGDRSLVYPCGWRVTGNCLFFPC